MTDDRRYRIRQATVRNGSLGIDWADGHSSEFHPVWLRHQCDCEACGTPLNAVRDLRLHHIPEDIAIARLEFDERRVSLAWTRPQHESTYRAKWLRDHCYSDSERRARKHRPVLWDASIEADPPTFDFNAIEASSTARLGMLETLCDYGFCKILNQPASFEEAHRLIELVGAQRRTHYGDYTLSTKAAVTNVGDACHALPPHCDETYRTSTIGITVFQVLRPASEGGASTLVDGFEAVRRLREAWPEDFERLTRTPVFTQRFDPARAEGALPKLYQCRLPMIRVDHDGDVSGVRINERQISPLELPADEIDGCYRAIRRLMKIVYDPALSTTYPLARGEGLLFDNQRVLHGRTAFKPEEPGRSVLTHSVDLEDFYSNLRILSAQLKPDQPPRVYASGMVI